MRLIAKKPCSFEGHKFFIGDEIPSGLVANPKAQEKMGVIAIAGGNESLPPEELQQYTSKVAQVKFEILIHSEEGDLPLQVTNEELSMFTDILQIPVAKTEDKQKVSEMIQNIESEDLLIMLDALDGRKFIKEEAQTRAQALTPNPDEQPGGDESDGEDNPPGEGETPNPDEQPGGDE